MTNQQGAPEALRLAAEVLDWMPTSDTQRALWDRHQKALVVVKAALVEAQQPAQSAAAASKAVLAAISAANMQLVRTGDDEFMLVTYKNAKAQCDGGQCGIGGYCDDCPTPQADSQPAPVLDRDRIREIFMAHGFTVKEGQTDLKQYVYDAADALLRAARAPADSGAAPAGWKLVPIEPSVDQEWEGKEASSRVSTMAEACKIYKAMLAAAPTPPAQAADSVLEDAARYRYLRDCNSGSLAVMEITGTGEDDWYILTEDHADAAIDAARKQGGA